MCPESLQPNNIAILIPAHNEALRIRSVVESALQQSPHVIVVNDGSTDATCDQLKTLPITLLHHPHRRGKGATLRTGFAHALAQGVLAIITIDGDGQHDPTDCSKLLATANRYPHRLVIGARLYSRENQPRVRRLGNALGDWGISWACGYQVIDSQSGLRLYPSSVLVGALADPTATDAFVYEAQLLIYAARVCACPVVAVPIASRYARSRQDASFRKSHFRLVRDLVKIILFVAMHIIHQGHIIREYRNTRAHPVTVDQTF